jgi:hypothetical protein
MTLYLKLLALLTLLVVAGYGVMQAGERDQAVKATKYIELTPTGPDLRSQEPQQYIGVNRISLSTSGYVERTGILLY